MSEATISSQIALEANASQSGSGTSSVNNNAPSDSQGSEFKEILEDSQNTALSSDGTEAVKDPLQVDDALLAASQDTLALADLNALLGMIPPGNTSPVGLNETIVAGKLLPAQSAARAGQVSEVPALLTPDQINLATGKLKADEAQPLLSNGLFADGDIFNDDGVLTAQLTASFTDNNAANIKQLNSNIIGQALLKQDPVLEQNLPLSAQPSFTPNQNAIVKPAESMLPAITVTPDNAQWNNQVGERINWMINGQMQRAEIRLDPPELGSLDIRLNIAKDNQASVVFHVNNTTAKEAIESAIPRLREMFEQQGLDLANVDVSQHNFQQQQQSAFAEYDHSEAGAAASAAVSNAADSLTDDTILATTNLSTRNSSRLLDTFA